MALECGQGGLEVEMLLLLEHTCLQVARLSTEGCCYNIKLVNRNGCSKLKHYVKLAAAGLRKHTSRLQ